MKLKNIFRFVLWTFCLAWAAAAHAIDGEYWGFCNGTRAYTDAAYTEAKPQADWVCQAPTADAAGEAIERNTLRCLLDQKQSCQLGGGGDAASRGDHNVPRDAWYWIPGATVQYPDVRCQCGCFAGDVEVLTHLGPMRMDEASQKASSLGGLSMAIFTSEQSGVKGSARLRNSDFVVGPEEKPLVHIITAAGKTLSLTDSHPVLVMRAGSWQMLRAEDLSVGDKLMSGTGTEDSVMELTSYRLPEASRLVYNFNTQGKNDYEHIVVANGLRVGDLNWQKRLDERHSRSDNFLKFAPR
jgi:hypothetical protein